MSDQNTPAPADLVEAASLLPCPWCLGSNLSVDTYDVQPDDYHSGYVTCADCDAQGARPNGWLSNKQDAHNEAIATWNRRAAENGKDDGYLVQRIGEIMEDGCGFWRACSGCQEASEGYVSTRDYPYSKVYRCQPGSGCSECGGIGVVWDDTDYEAYAKFCMQPDPREATIAELIEALTPFAQCADQISDAESDEEWAKFRLLVKDYRRARTALANAEGRNNG